MKLIRYNYPANPTVSSLGDVFRDPFSDFEPFSRLFNVERVRDFLNSDPGFPGDLYEDDNNYYARFELPGIEKKDVHVQIEADGSLLVQVEHSDEQEGGTKQIKASRRMSLPETAQREGISAKLENGLLTVTLPKQETQKPLAIEIQ